jgi:transglutaminase-like putative cysteine protease
MTMQRARTSAKPTKKLEASSPSITRPRAELKQKVDWGGTYIVPPDETVQRLVPGTKRPRPVRMDLRAFVPSHPSIVMSAWVEARLKHDVKKHAWLEPLVLGMRRPASFDTVAHLVADAVFENIEYKLRDGATWQLPEETLARGQGDCEDRATLLAASLIAAGISPYNVRVALGTVRLTRHGKAAGAKAHA